ncbi:hypothetical protein O6H91_09G044100 [Diphasiastrum complanatum]|uniref:Uncharacterized protein n=1 Tax=Diphasiastrum complanatum TaxID=34168 RepID=A0ACC2CNR9_DIPCM|nr:hypothetical protein O6H91_09G044100 [Diphasiastrum complanatum]
MDRLLAIEPKEVVMHFEVGRTCVGVFNLRNLMHTMPVAFKVQTTAPKRYVVKPPNGIIRHLGVAIVEIVCQPQSDLPDEFPFMQHKFVVKSVVAPAGAPDHGAIPNDWFCSRKRHVYSDTSLRVVIVGGCILRSLAATGSMENVREVLERDVDVDSVDKLQGLTAMHFAIAKRRPEIVQLLLEFDPDLEIKNKQGHTALQEAVILRDSLTTEVLLAKGANTEAKNPAGCTALHYAIGRRSLAVVRMLLNHGADVNATLKDGRTALYIAALKRDKACVKLLIDQGAQVEARGPDGLTPLHNAAARGDGALVKLLLSGGAETEALTPDGKTPYDLAAESEHEDLYDVLKIGDELRSGSRKGNLETVRQCLRQGAFLNGQDQNGWSALHCAAFKGHINIVKYLIGKGADMECRDEKGYTALHCATEAGRTHVAQLLITKGANLNAKIKKGATALQIAQSMNFTGLILLLSEQSDHRKSNDSFEFCKESFDPKKENSIPVQMKASHNVKKTMFSMLDRHQCAATG